MSVGTKRERKKTFFLKNHLSTSNKTGLETLFGTGLINIFFFVVNDAPTQQATVFEVENFL
jgi:hypothetical protein